MAYGFDVWIEDEQALDGAVWQLAWTDVWDVLAPGATLNAQTGRVEQIRFPHPFDDLTVRDGERVQGAKAARYREAMRVLGEVRRGRRH